MGRKPNSHAESPLISCLFKRLINGWRAYPQNRLLAIFCWKTIKCKVAWNKASLKMQGLEAAVDCSTVTACTMAGRSRGQEGRGGAKRRSGRARTRTPGNARLWGSVQVPLPGCALCFSQSTEAGQRRVVWAGDTDNEGRGDEESTWYSAASKWGNKNPKGNIWM